MIEFERLGKRVVKTSTKLLARAFLTVHAWHFLNPANPPFPAPLDDGCVLHFRYAFRLQVSILRSISRCRKCRLSESITLLPHAALGPMGTQGGSPRRYFSSKLQSIAKVSTSGSPE